MNDTLSSLSASPPQAPVRSFLSNGHEKHSSTFHYGPKQKKKTDRIAILSFTVPRAMEWAKWENKQTSERSGARERSNSAEQANEWVVRASERGNGQVSGPVFTSRFLAVLNQCAHSPSLSLSLDVHTWWLRARHCLWVAPRINGAWNGSIRAKIPIGRRPMVMMREFLLVGPRFCLRDF